MNGSRSLDDLLSTGPDDSALSATRKQSATTPDSETLEAGVSASSFWSRGTRSSVVRRSLNYGDSDSRHPGSEFVTGFNLLRMLSDEHKDCVKNDSETLEDQEEPSGFSNVSGVSSVLGTIRQPRQSVSVPSTPTKQLTPIDSIACSKTPDNPFHQKQAPRHRDRDAPSVPNITELPEFDALSSKIRATLTDILARFAEFDRIIANDGHLEQHELSKSFGVDLASLNLTSFTNAGASRTNSREQGELEFLLSLPNQELVQLFDAELIKRRHCERKLLRLEREKLSLEERLTLVESLLGQERTAVQQLSSQLTDFLSQLHVTDDRRIAQVRRLQLDAMQLKKSVSLNRAYEQSMTRRLAESQSLQQKSTELIQKLHSESQHAKFRCDALQLKLENESKKNNDLTQRLQLYQAAETSWADRERDYTKELLALERSLNTKMEDVSELATQLQASTKERQLLMKEHDAKLKTTVSSLTAKHQKDFDDLETLLTSHKELEITELNDRHSCELRQLYDTVRCVTEERDNLKRELELLRTDLEQRQQLMCAELQQKLAGKYAELLSEIGAPNVQSATLLTTASLSSATGERVNTTLQVTQPSNQHSPAGTASTALPTYNMASSESGALSLAEGFLRDLQQANSLNTPRPRQWLLHVDSKEGKRNVQSTVQLQQLQLLNVNTTNATRPSVAGTQYNMNEQDRRTQLQLYLRQALSNRPNDSNQSTSDQVPSTGAHPTDPRTAR